MIYFIFHTLTGISSMQISYSIGYVAVLSWQMEEYSKNKQHRSYLEESHHAVQYIADNFGMVSTKTKRVNSFIKAEKTAFKSTWTKSSFPRSSLKFDRVNEEEINKLLNNYCFFFTSTRCHDSVWEILFLTSVTVEVRSFISGQILNDFEIKSFLLG